MAHSELPRHNEDARGGTFAFVRGLAPSPAMSDVFVDAVDDDAVDDDSTTIEMTETRDHVPSRSPCLPPTRVP